MLLLNNVFITDTKFHEAVTHIPGKKAYERYLLPEYDQIDIYKYSLASWAALPLDKAVIFCELDENYKHRYDEIEEFVNKEFKCKVLFFRYRNTCQKDWQRTINDFSSNFYLYICNHDHVFIDTDLNEFNLLEGRMRLRYFYSKLDCVSSFVSHWPEMLNVASNQWAQLKDGILEYQWRTNSSVQIVSREVLQKWWCTKDYGDEFLPRPDWFFFNIDEVESLFCLPRRELFRHFDGYSLASILPERCPPLSIPDGFFTNTIRLACGPTKNKTPGITIVNPLSTSYKALDQNGADIIDNDIPLFWKHKVRADYLNEDIDPILAKENIDKYYINRARAKKEYEHIPLEWIKLNEL